MGMDWEFPTTRVHAPKTCGGKLIEYWSIWREERPGNGGYGQRREVRKRTSVECTKCDYYGARKGPVRKGGWF